MAIATIATVHNPVPPHTDKIVCRLGEFPELSALVLPSENPHIGPRFPKRS